MSNFKFAETEFEFALRTAGREQRDELYRRFALKTFLQNGIWRTNIEQQEVETLGQTLQLPES